MTSLMTSWTHTFLTLISKTKRDSGRILLRTYRKSSMLSRMVTWSMTSRGRMTSQWRYNAAGRHTTSPTGLYNGQVFMACNDCRVINGIISGRRRPQTARNAIVNIQQHTWKCLRLYMTAVTWRSLLSHVWYSRHSHTRPRQHFS